MRSCIDIYQSRINILNLVKGGLILKWFVIKLYILFIHMYKRQLSKKCPITFAAIFSYNHIIRSLVYHKNKIIKKIKMIIIYLIQIS